MPRFLLLYLLVVNVLTYGVFWFDKRRARSGGRRTSERELLTWALVGGTLGAFLAMRRFRHKTKKTRFKVAFGTVVVAQAVAIAFASRWGP